MDTIHAPQQLKAFTRSTCTAVLVTQTEHFKVLYATMIRLAENKLMQNVIYMQHDMK